MVKDIVFLETMVVDLRRLGDGQVFGKVIRLASQVVVLHLFAIYESSSCGLFAKTPNLQTLSSTPSLWASDVWRNEYLAILSEIGLPDLKY